MAIFRPKPWKMSIFRLFEPLISIAQKGVFSFQNIVKDILLPYIALKKAPKMAILRPKPWINPFGKMSIFRLIVVLFFTAQKGVFLFQNMVTDVFLCYIAKKKKLEKGPLLAENHGLIRLAKCQFLNFLNVFFLQPKKVFFRSRIS